MKKLLLALWLVAALGTVFVSHAESGLDLSTYSVEQLLQIHEEVLSELEGRGYRKSAVLEIGRYTAGADLPAGTYTIELSETADPNDFGYFNYAVYDETGEVLEQDTMCKAALKIDLDEGYSLEIERAPVKITTYTIVWQ